MSISWDRRCHSTDNIPRYACETQSCTVGIRGGNGFLRTSGHRQMMNPSVMNLQHRLVLELSVGLSFDQRQAQWRIDLFWRQLQALSARSYRSLARNMHSSGYTQNKRTLSQRFVIRSANKRSRVKAHTIDQLTSDRV